MQVINVWIAKSLMRNRFLQIHETWLSLTKVGFKLRIWVFPSLIPVLEIKLLQCFWRAQLTWISVFTWQSYAWISFTIEHRSSWTVLLKVLIVSANYFEDSIQQIFILVINFSLILQLKMPIEFNFVIYIFYCTLIEDLHLMFLYEFHYK